MPVLDEWPYQPDAGRLFAATLADLPWAVLLDSGRPGAAGGRFDILAAAPRATLVTRGGSTEIRSSDGVRRSRQDPFVLLQDALGPRRPVSAEVPFWGGALGYFGYDLGRRFERLPQIARDAEGLPEMAVGLYDWALVTDHARQRTYFVGDERRPAVRARGAELRERLRRAGASRVPAFRVTGPVRSNMDAQAYARAFARIKHYLRAGDCYQVNLAQRFAAPAQGDAWAAYLMLRDTNPAPFAAYLNLPFAQVLSASPERFLRVVDGRVETKPIKGTRPRSPDPASDRRLARELCASDKDRAENLMIVDLLRNDLGKSCRCGSVQVPRLFDLESFATVHHLVSTVTGRLAKGRGPLELLRGCFPGGSITGAPKLRAMEIIEELEPHRRGVYCGAIGYVGHDGGMDTNIAIRTLVYSAGVIRCWAGGGLVVDSELDAEYQESFDKAAALLRVLNRFEAAGQEHRHVGG